MLLFWLACMGSGSVALVAVDSDLDNDSGAPVDSGPVDSGPVDTGPVDTGDRLPALAQAITEQGLLSHLEALQAIADANRGNRSAYSAGYSESADYVAGQLEDAGYIVDRVPFTVSSSGDSRSLTHLCVREPQLWLGLLGVLRERLRIRQWRCAGRGPDDSLRAGKTAAPAAVSPVTLPPLSLEASR